MQWCKIQLKLQSRTCMDGVGVVDEVVPPPEGLVAKFALEALPAVHRLDVRVEAPLAHQSPAASAYVVVGMNISNIDAGECFQYLS